MEEKKSFIAFWDDDNKKKEDWVEVIEKNVSYVKFNYQGKEITIPWHRVLKLKEDGE
jgi:uncharacterized protein (UPF0248 family)